MPMFKSILSSLNLANVCRRQGVSLWQCPQFLFLIMGLFIIGANLSTYSIGTKFIADPELVALIVIALTFILFLISFTIVKSFEKLSEVAKMKSEFVDIVSHQLRTPLTGLKWALSAYGENAEKRENCVEIISESTARMEELVDDLLYVSRIEQGKIISEKKPTDVCALLRSIMNEYEMMAKAGNVSLEIDCLEKFPLLMIDAKQFKIVAENLIGNAVKYTKKGKVKVSISVSGDGLRLQVDDSGVGIPRGEQKFIFQKFFRSNNPLREERKGSGLGLFIAKSIIERAGGKIGFSSNENQGSSFWFTIPI